MDESRDVASLEQDDKPTPIDAILRTARTLMLFPIRVRAREAATMLSMDWEEMKKIPFAELPYTRRQRVRYYYVGSLFKYAEREDAASRKRGDDPQRFRLTKTGA